jgi:two-component system, NtrC family, response regulator AtoC
MSETILVVDDELSNRRIVEQVLSRAGYRVETAEDGAKALKKLEALHPDLIILDYMMPEMSGMEVLRDLRRRDDDTPVIMVTAYGSVERAVEAMHEGAYDFVTRPLKPEHILHIVRKALERQRLKRGVEVLAQEVGERYQLIVGDSTRMKQAVDLARKTATSNATVLLLGESGTGKEIFARSIHNWSERADRPFIAINSVGLSKELLESELFGYEPGAFTGAQRRKKGKVELAQGGTIFFDEIGDISRDLQSKLLRFLQEREFERVGGTTSIAVDVRVIAATNRDLERAVREGTFREDLYHRLNVVAIRLPPLRERREDLPALMEYLLRKQATAIGKNITGFTDEARERMATYSWPGNVRELANVIERAVVLSSGPNITLRSLPSGIASGEGSGLFENLSYRDGMNAARKLLILKALSRTQGNRSAAARLLGLESKYLLKLMKSLGID